MSLPVITDANSPIPADHIKIHITCADQDKFVLIDLSHPFQVMGHLHDVLAQSLGGLVTANRVKLTFRSDDGVTHHPSAADSISDVINVINSINNDIYHMEMSIEEWVPFVYSTNPFEMRKEWDMYRPVYNPSDPW